MGISWAVVLDDTMTWSPLELVVPDLHRLLVSGATGCHFYENTVQNKPE
jgi:hypothetical protein